MPSSGTAEPGLADTQRVPGRVLILSATIGEGHNAVGRVIDEAIGKTWPGCEVAWLDALDVMGPGIGPLARAVYQVQISRTPWMYEFFFRAIWRHRWFLDFTRSVIGWWCGRRLARELRRLRPDVIVSTYPLGSAGLAWLRRRGRLAARTGAWVSDFCPHPYWLYRDLDVTYVMHPSAVPVATTAEPGARIAVCALPVGPGFQPAASRDSARTRLGLDPGRFVVLLSTGSLSFGNVEQAAEAILAAGPRVQLVVICGRNDALRARLSASPVPGRRLLVLGWVDDMPGWFAAADVLVTNGGGVTVLEAVASGTPVVMFQPIAGHGRANAALMAAAGLAVVCGGTAGLTAAMSQRLASTRPPPGPGAREAASAQPAGRDVGGDLRELAARPAAADGMAAVRAEDALFLHTQSPRAPQQVGAVVLLSGERIGRAALCAAVAGRVAQLPELRRRLMPARGAWDRPRWAVEAGLDVESRITEVSLAAGESLDRLVERYFATPLEVTAAPWEMLLVRGEPDAGGHGRDAVVVKVHHALGDSFTLVTALSGLFDPAAVQGPRPGGPARPRGLTRPDLARARRVTAGLSAMVRAGRAPASGFSGSLEGQGLLFTRLALPARELTVAARRLRTSTADLLLALAAEALGRLLAARGEDLDGRVVRVMVPRTVAPFSARFPASAGLAWPGQAGNRTAGILLDVPVGPMPFAERAAAVHALHQAGLRRGDAEAAAFVLRAMNVLPLPLQRSCARFAYNGDWFSVIVSVFPGIRQPRQLLSSAIGEVYPVLALADRTSLAVGAMTWGDSMLVGIVADAGLVPDVAEVASAIRQSFAACGGGGPAGDGAGPPGAVPG